MGADVGVPGRVVGVAVGPVLGVLVAFGVAVACGGVGGFFVGATGGFGIPADSLKVDPLLTPLPGFTSDICDPDGDCAKHESVIWSIQISMITKRTSSSQNKLQVFQQLSVCTCLSYMSALPPPMKLVPIRVDRFH